jgi:hypothetical protein
MKYIFFLCAGSLLASDNKEPQKQEKPLPIRRACNPQKKSIFKSGEFGRKELPEFGKGIIPLVPAQTGKTEETVQDEQAK